MSLCFKYFNELNTRYFGVGELAVFLLCYCCVSPTSNRRLPPLGPGAGLGDQHSADCG